MVHFVLSRAFSDSQLGSGGAIHALPELILIGTAIALVLNVLLSWLSRHRERSNVRHYSGHIARGGPFPPPPILQVNLREVQDRSEHISIRGRTSDSQRLDCV